jgi:hypothetical protein
MLDHRQADRMLAVATHGSGMFTATIPNNWNITGAEESAEISSEMVMYPNPAQADFNIKTKAFENGVVDLMVMDLSGKVVLSKKVGYVNNKAISVKAAGFAAGIYVVQLSQNGKVISEKLVVE